MAINKHGLNITGLKKASGDTHTTDGYYQIWHDRDTGETWATWLYDRTWWRNYHDPAVILVCSCTNHMTMQAIADAIHAAINREEII